MLLTLYHITVEQNKLLLLLYAMMDVTKFSEIFSDLFIL